MFKLDLDRRLSAWSSLRKQLETSETPLEDTIEFWNMAQLIGHNPLIDPYYQASWPTPWEIIEHNRYDDFTKAIMIGYTLLLTERYKNNVVEIKTLIDKEHKRLYNVVYIDEVCVLNFSDTDIVTPDQIPEDFCVENLVILISPR